MNTDLFERLERTINHHKPVSQCQTLHQIRDGIPRFCFAGLIADLYVRSHPESAKWIVGNMTNADNITMILDFQGHKNALVLPIEIRHWARVSDTTMSEIIDLNDDGYIFEEILSYIKNEKK